MLTIITCIKRFQYPIFMNNVFSNQNFVITIYESHQNMEKHLIYEGLGVIKAAKEKLYGYYCVQL